jgi:hypothetical protein
MDNLKRMLEQKGLQLLDLASANYLPGHLIKIHYFWRPGDFGPETRLDEDRGLATQILKIPDLALTPRGPSDIAIQNVTDQFQISAGAGLPQFGLTAGTDVQRGIAITWNILRSKRLLSVLMTCRAISVQCCQILGRLLGRIQPTTAGSRNAI